MKKMSPVVKYGGGFILLCIVFVVIALSTGLRLDNNKELKTEYSDPRVREM